MVYEWHIQIPPTPHHVYMCVCVCLCVCVLSHFVHVWLFVTLWTVVRQTPLSMGFSRQEYWSGLSCSPPGDIPDPGMKPCVSYISCTGRCVLDHQHHLGSPSVHENFSDPTKICLRSLVLQLLIVSIWLAYFLGSLTAILGWVVSNPLPHSHSCPSWTLEYDFIWNQCHCRCNQLNSDHTRVGWTLHPIF